MEQNMNIDNGLIFSEAQAVTASAASTNVIDTLAAGNALSDALFVNVDVDTTCTSANSTATVTVALQSCATESGSYSTLVASAAIPVASLVQGYRCLQVRVPSGAARYLQVYYTAGTENLSAGKFNAVLTDGVDNSFAVK